MIHSNEGEINSQHTLERLFSQLDIWRHFPNYQLERRADIFFTVYLQELLEWRVQRSICSTIIPEFPLKRDLVGDYQVSHRSVKVDYLLFSEDNSVIYFLELKTDRNSRNSTQDDYLMKAQSIGFQQLLQGLKQIVLHSTQIYKYFHLLTSLAKVGIITLPENAEENLYSSNQNSAKEILDSIYIPEVSHKIEVCYIQPQAEEVLGLVITFDDIIEFLEHKTDSFSALFKKYLGHWKVQAGEVKPSNLPYK